MNDDNSEAQGYIPTWVCGPKRDMLIAAACGDIVALRAAIEFGAAIGFLSHLAGRIAARNGHWSIVEEIMSRDDAIVFAAKFGATEFVRYLLDHGANLSVSDRLPPHFPPVHYAAREGHVDVVLMLIDRGADARLAGDVVLTELCENRCLGVESGHGRLLTAMVDAGHITAASAISSLRVSDLPAARAALAIIESCLLPNIKAGNPGLCPVGI